MLAAEPVKNQVTGDNTDKLAGGSDQEHQIGVHDSVQVAADAHANAQVDCEQDHPGVEDDEAAADEHGRAENAADGVGVVVGLFEVV